MSEGARHIPVLVDSVMEVLAPRDGETYLDCTAGLGGHAAAVAGRVGPSGRILLNDVDPANLSLAEGRLRTECGPRTPQVISIRGNFAEAPRRLEEQGLKADMVLADLGFSSNQVQTAERGFSFVRDGPLDMRMDPSLPTTAADLIASLSQFELAALLREFGEERDANRIARKIVEARRMSPIRSTGQLAEIIRGPRITRPGAIDPATRSFQALRIAVNDELGSLNSLLAAIKSGAPSVVSWLQPGARIAIITFHSLEDRAVKQAFRALADARLATDLTRHPVEASEEEQAANPRSRSAKLRAIRIAPRFGDPQGPSSEDGGAQ